MDFKEYRQRGECWPNLGHKVHSGRRKYVNTGWKSNPTGRIFDWPQGGFVPAVCLRLMACNTWPRHRGEILANQYHIFKSIFIDISPAYMAVFV